MPKLGILITNTGTPDAPNTSAVRRYLKEFLSDPRIVQLPRLIWLPILYGLVLTLRPRRSAELYQKIWTPDGSPMRTIMQRVSSTLAAKVNQKNKEPIEVEMGMNYGAPSIPHALASLKQKQIDRMIVLPLFPQYSNTSTASSFDRVLKHLAQWQALPDLSLIRDYSVHPRYIETLAQTVTQTWNQQGHPEHLIISFHGIPERFVKNGDPYQMQCEKTAQLLANALSLPKEKWTLCYQSQFGYDKWLKPSTQMIFSELPKQGIKHIDVICPGFSVDCLETLEEIAITGKKTFLQAGGKELRYIPALNDSEAHVDMLAEIILERISPSSLKDYSAT